MRLLPGRSSPKEVLVDMVLDMAHGLPVLQAMELKEHMDHMLGLMATDHKEDGQERTVLQDSALRTLDNTYMMDHGGSTMVVLRPLARQAQGKLNRTMDRWWMWFLGTDRWGKDPVILKAFSRSGQRFGDLESQRNMFCGMAMAKEHGLPARACLFGTAQLLEKAAFLRSELRDLAPHLLSSGCEKYVMDADKMLNNLPTDFASDMVPACKNDYLVKSAAKTVYDVERCAQSASHWGKGPHSLPQSGHHHGFGGGAPPMGDSYGHPPQPAAPFHPGGPPPGMMEADLTPKQQEIRDAIVNAQKLAKDKVDKEGYMRVGPIKTGPGPMPPAPKMPVFQEPGPSLDNSEVPVHLPVWSKDQLVPPAMAMCPWLACSALAFLEVTKWREGFSILQIYLDQHTNA
eukprot:g24131.t1